MSSIIDFILNTACQYVIGLLNVLFVQYPWISVILAVIILWRMGRNRGVNTWRKVSSFVTGKTKKEVDDEMAVLIAKAMIACQKSGKKMNIIYDPIADVTSLTMSTCPKMFKTIVMSPSWIPFLTGATPDSEYDWKVSYYQSIGHELGHQFDKPSVFGVPIRWSKAERRLFCWLREVKCDLYSIAFVVDQFSLYTKKDIMVAIDVKISVYTAEKGDVAGRKHPSWAVRKSIMENHSELDADVIELLVKESGCQNQDFIDAMYELYGIDKNPR